MSAENPQKKRAVNYVNNRDFYEAIKRYQEDVRLAEEQGKPPPIIPRYIGECITKIAERLSFHRNFIGYDKGWKSEMISDAIFDCLNAVTKFNTKYENPFAYMSQIAWMAFVRRITTEKKQMYITYKVYEMEYVNNSDFVGDPNASSELQLQDNLTNDHIRNFVKDYEGFMDRRREKNKKRKEDNENSTDN